MEPHDQSGANTGKDLHVEPEAVLRQSSAVAATQTRPTQPQLADDSDTIEEEWVAIVKRILEEHREDPYSLTRAMAMLRSDYLKKRYNKESKVAD